MAGAIAEQLNAKLTGAEQEAVAQKPTDNSAAYQADLRGRSISTEGYDYATMRKVISAYTEAVRLDPKFALAWADLANTTGYLYFNGVDPELYRQSRSSGQPIPRCNCNPGWLRRNWRRASTATGCCAISPVRNRLSRLRLDRLRTIKVRGNSWAWWSAGRESGSWPCSIWNKRRNSGRATAG